MSEPIQLDVCVRWTPTGSSRLVRELFGLTPRQRSTLGISDVALQVVDVVFAVVAAASDENDERCLEERVADLEQLVPVFERPEFEAALSRWSENPVMPRILMRLTSPTFKKFLIRLLGTRRVDRLKRAIENDGRVIAAGTRRGLAHLLPLATAMDHCMRTLTPEQKSAVEGADGLGDSSIFELSVKLDVVLSRFVADGLELDKTPVRPEEMTSLPGGLGDLAELMFEKIAIQSTALIDDLGSLLARKVQGARDALEHSADPVSQAANSLIEFVDRLLRDAFDEAEVLAWICDNFSERRDRLEFTRNGATHPTKYAQSLCFVYAGSRPDGRSLVHELCAASMTAVRSQLQNLKHADLGSDEERQRIAEMLATVESLLVLIAKVGWLSADDSHLTAMKSRLAPAA